MQRVDPLAWDRGRPRVQDGPALSVPASQAARPGADPEDRPLGFLGLQERVDPAILQRGVFRGEQAARSGGAPGEPAAGSYPENRPFRPWGLEKSQHLHVGRELLVESQVAIGQAVETCPGSHPERRAAGSGTPEHRDPLAGERRPRPQDTPRPRLPAGEPPGLRGKPVDRPFHGAGLGEAEHHRTRQARVAVVERPPASRIQHGQAAGTGADPEERPASGVGTIDPHDLIGEQAGVVRVQDLPALRGAAHQASRGAGPQLRAGSGVEPGQAEDLPAGEPLLQDPAIAVEPGQAAEGGRPDQRATRLAGHHQIPHRLLRQSSAGAQHAPAAPHPAGQPAGRAHPHLGAVVSGNHQDLPHRPFHRRCHLPPPGPAVPLCQPLRGSRPDQHLIAAPLLRQAPHGARRKVRATREHGPDPLFPSGNAVAQRHPERTVRGGEKVSNGAERLPTRPLDGLPGAAVIERDAILRSGPEEAVRVLNQGLDGVLRQSLLGAEKTKRRAATGKRSFDGGGPRQGRTTKEEDRGEARNHSAPSIRAQGLPRTAAFCHNSSWYQKKRLPFQGAFHGGCQPVLVEDRDTPCPVLTAGCYLRRILRGLRYEPHYGETLLPGIAPTTRTARPVPSGRDRPPRDMVEIPS